MHLLPKSLERSLCKYTSERVTSNRRRRADHYIETIRDGDDIKVKITDTGKGIEEEAINKVFDPFFTTKSIGQGSGLGLYIVNQLCELNDASISIEKNVYGGTSFIIHHAVTPVNQEAV